MHAFISRFPFVGEASTFRFFLHSSRLPLVTRRKNAYICWYLRRDEELRETVESPLEIVRAHVEEVHRVFRVRVGVTSSSMRAEIRGVTVECAGRGGIVVITIVHGGGGGWACRKRLVRRG